MGLRCLLFLSSVFFFSSIQAQEAEHNPDPWEGFNRKVYVFNDAVDRAVLKPVAKGYQWLTPDMVETGINNAFANLWELNTIVNDVLQFKLGQAVSDTSRFLVNSTVGLLGLFDVATSMGLEKHEEDFGQTLGYWGVSSGPYVMVPLLGPFTVRDGFGRVVDGQADYVANLDYVPTRNELLALRIVDTRASLLEAEKLITGDRYTFIRDAYLQRREYLVKDGVVEDGFGEEDFDEDMDAWE
jgi:phospholipid-binding lipoprotein MlaA